MAYIAGTSNRIESAPDPRLHAALAAWQECPRVADLADSRSLIIADDVRPWCGIVDVDPAGRIGRYVFVGAEVIMALGQDMTGRSTSDLKPQEFAEVIERQYVEAVRARRPLIHAIWSAALPQDVYYRVTIPLSAGGTDVAQLWMVTAHLKRFAANLPARARDLDAALFA
jgi:hypothetical protein